MELIMPGTVIVNDQGNREREKLLRNQLERSVRLKLFELYKKQGNFNDLPTYTAIIERGINKLYYCEVEINIQDRFYYGHGRSKNPVSAIQKTLERLEPLEISPPGKLDDLHTRKPKESFRVA